MPLREFQISGQSITTRGAASAPLARFLSTKKDLLGYNRLGNLQGGAKRQWIFADAQRGT
jgi:hypothetical protein